MFVSNNRYEEKKSLHLSIFLWFNCETYLYTFIQMCTLLYMYMHTHTHECTCSSKQWSGGTGSDNGDDLKKTHAHTELKCKQYIYIKPVISLFTWCL